MLNLDVRKWAIQNFPYLISEDLTDLEIMYRLLGEINRMSVRVDELPQEVQTAVETWINEHPEFYTKVADGAISELKLDELLRDKVNYPLDVLEPRLLESDQRINNNSEAIAVNSSRIDEFTTLPSGSTAGDAELTDVRVGADGTRYDNAGTAVRTQVSQLTGSITSLRSDIDIITAAEKIEWEQGFWAVATGEGDPNNINWIRSKADIPSTTKTLDVDNGSDLIVFLIAWDGFNYLGGWTGSGWSKTYDISMGVKHYNIESIMMQYPSCKFRLSAKKYSGASVNPTESNAIKCTYKISSITESIENHIEYTTLLHRIGVIGDSLSSGEIAYADATGEHYIDCYNYSWLANMCRVNNAEYVHYSAGGLTCKSWLDGSHKTDFDNDAVCNAYFIALGTNDRNASYPIGDSDDPSGTDSFVGYYKSIINLIKAKNPNSIILVLSLYSNNNTYVPYSNVISEISRQYSNCYFVDFANSSDIHNTDGATDYVSYGHFTSVGYIKVANTIRTLVNKILKDNQGTNFIKLFFPVGNQ